MKVIKIGAKWCPGCLVMKPRWKKIENELDWLETEYYDYDEDQEKVDEIGIKSSRLPVFVFVDSHGEEILRLHGEHPKDKLIDLVKKHKGK